MDKPGNSGLHTAVRKIMAAKINYFIRVKTLIRLKLTVMHLAGGRKSSQWISGHHGLL